MCGVKVNNFGAFVFLNKYLLFLLFLIIIYTMSYLSFSGIYYKENGLMTAIKYSSGFNGSPTSKFKILLSIPIKYLII